MPAHKAPGPSKPLVWMFVIGVVLLLWATLVPTVHSVWQVILGALLAVISVGKMVAR